MTWWPFRRHRSLGRRGEDIAAAHLRRAGLKVLARNVHLGRYEIDIIARERDTVAFVEVKTRRDDGFAAPEDNVTAEKQRRIRRAAREYIARCDDPSVYYRFDVVSVVLRDDAKPDVTHFRDAFHDE
ncbi:MAG: YraN family protein [Candidatus Hydrogenedentes bacterium]|nr:YraN family protein [Candidatus Hydrogenedentota bacterium]